MEIINDVVGSGRGLRWGEVGSREKRDVENGLRIGVPRDECLVRGAGTALWAGCWVGTSPAGKMWLLVRAERGGRRDGEEAEWSHVVRVCCGEGGNYLMDRRFERCGCHLIFNESFARADSVQCAWPSRHNDDL